MVRVMVSSKLHTGRQPNREVALSMRTVKVMAQRCEREKSACTIRLLLK
jgi:hypothetical protein